MPYEKETQIESLHLRGVSLKFKLVFFTVALVLMVVLLVSLPLGMMMQSTQERTLVKSLEDRVEILLDGLASRVHAYLPTENILELSFLPDQTSALTEANYATVIGVSPNQGASMDYVWATNDPRIADKISTDTLTLGVSRLDTPQVSGILDSCTHLNDIARAQAGDTASEITRLTIEALSMVSSASGAAVARRNQIQGDINRLSESLSESLDALSKENAGSIPYFKDTSFDRSNTTYLFYRPVMYRQGADQNFVRAIVFMEVSTTTLIEGIADAQRRIFLVTLLIALLAVALGTIGALVLASVIINPLRRLATHVAMIRDADDKEHLADKRIVITTHDEFRLLGDTVNEMTEALVHAAAAAKDLTVGKEVQKMFIPLETDKAGRKLTTGKVEDTNAEFFGYYEGAKGVSGDYFDYKQLDDRWYAVIKCDVSGKGFRRHSSWWKWQPYS